MKLKLISFQSKPPVNEKKLGPTIPDHIREQMEKSQDNQEDDSIPVVQMSADDPSADEVKMMNDEPSEDEVSVKRKRGDRGTKRRLKPEEVKESQEENYYKIGMDSKYDVWVPPVGQSGDGKTSLNEKLGY